MPDDCFFPDNDEKDDSDMEFDIGHSDSPHMNTSIFSASADLSGTYNDDSSDDAPDEVSFQTSKASAIEEIKHAFETVRLQKQKQKEKRQKRQEVFAAQKLIKKQRLDQLAQKRLPDDMLHNIASIHTATNGVEMVQTINREEIIKQRESLMTSLEKNTQEEQALQSSSPTKKKRRKRNEKRNQLCKPAGELAPKQTLDFIPLDSKATEFHVRVLEKTVDTIVPKTAMLKDLKNKLIFGKLNRRVPAKTAAAKVAKQEVSGLNNHYKMK